MKSGIEQILGKTVGRVVVAASTIRQMPSRHIFVTSTSGRLIEIYGENFSGASGVTPGGLPRALEYVNHLEVSKIDIYRASAGSPMARQKNGADDLWTAFEADYPDIAEPIKAKLDEITARLDAICRAFGGH